MEINIEKARFAIKRLRTLCHPINRRIVTLLETEKELDVTDIYEKLRLQQPIASHYLIELRERGILLSRRDGRKIYYSVNPLFVDQLKEGVESCVKIEIVK